VHLAREQGEVVEMIMLMCKPEPLIVKSSVASEWMYARLR
jgi:hypothetical protein